MQAGAKEEVDRTQRDVPAKSVRASRLKGLLWCLFVLVGIALISKNLFYALVPYGGQTEAIWAQYYELADEDIDTLIAGSSYGMECIDPEILDEQLGWSAFSLATPFQTRAATMRAVQDAYEDHHIKRLILGVGIDKISSDDSGLEYDLSFAHGESLNGSPLRFLQAYADVAVRKPYFGNASSLGVFAPWLVWHVDFNRAAIEENISMRKTMTPQEACSQQKLTVTERGHIPHYGTVDLDVVGMSAVTAADDEYVLTDFARQQYLDLLNYCNEHDIEVIMITTPWPDCSLMRFEREGGYAVAMAQLADVAKEGGSELLDFALVRPEVFETTIEDYHDAFHLNGEGAQRFTHVLAQTLGDVEADKDVSGQFFDHTYEGWEAYLDSVKGIALITYDYEVDADSIDLTMRAYTERDLPIEFEVLAAEEGEEPHVVRPYSQDNTYSYPIEGSGVVTIGVRGRRVGSDLDAEHTCVLPIGY